MALEALCEIDRIKIYLNSKIVSKEIQDYRISFRFNMDVDVWVLLPPTEKNTSFSVWNISSYIEDSSFSREDFFRNFDGEKNISLDIISVEDVESDDFYNNLFSTDGKTSSKGFNARRRFDELLQRRVTQIKTPVPVVAFYGYESSGNSTNLLVDYAKELACIGKKVFVLDFSFFVPRVLSYLQNTPNKGFIEYFSDKKFLATSCSVNISNYTVTISDCSSVVNNPLHTDIVCMPAGDMSDSKSYLEGLSRINLDGSESVELYFLELLDSIQKGFSPDVVLLDTPNGFNSILATVVKPFSKLLVSSFTDTETDLIGLRFIMQDDVLASKSLYVRSGDCELEDSIFLDAIKDHCNEDVADNTECFNTSDLMSFEKLFERITCLTFDISW